MPGADAQLGRHRDVLGLSFVLPAIPASAPTARHRLRAWLATLAWPTHLAEDLEFATNEAVTNVIDHAYPTHTDTSDNPAGHQAVLAAAEQIVEVMAQVQARPDGTRQICIQVRDRGRWQLPPADPGYRGRGLMTMAAIMDQITVQHGSPNHTGTTTTLLSPLTTSDSTIL